MQRHTCSYDSHSLYLYLILSHHALLAIFTVHLTKAQPKGNEGKRKVIASLRDGIDEFDNLLVFKFESMRTNFFKELRKLCSDSRYVLQNKNDTYLSHTLLAD